MPVKAFNRLLTYIGEAEQRDVSIAAYPVQSARSDAAECLTFPLAKVFARCARCEGVEFRREMPEAPLKMSSTLLCGACGAEVIHGDLLAQLANGMIARRKRNRSSQSRSSDALAGG
jgi:hypothetical protein